MKRNMNRWVAVFVILALLISALPFPVTAAQRSDLEVQYEELPESVREQVDNTARESELKRQEIIFETQEKLKETAENEEETALPEWEAYLNDTDGEGTEPPADLDEEVNEDAESAEAPITEAVGKITAAVEKAGNEKAASVKVQDNGVLDGLKQKNTIISKINEYRSGNSNLREGTNIYMFEGGSNSVTEYTASGVRDQAVAVVVKGNEIVYVEPCCSTIPDAPDVMATDHPVWPSAATVKDGVYSFSDEKFGGYNAYKIEGGGEVPCIRLNQNTKEIIETTADGIFIHTRNGCSTGGGWSTGCMLVADGGERFTAFRDAVGTNTSGHIVIDRSLAVQGLGKLYEGDLGYTGAVKAMTGIDYTSLHFENVSNFLEIEKGTDPHISGLVISNHRLDMVEVTVSGDLARQSHSVNPGTASYSLEGSEIDNVIDFSTLPIGQYKFTMRARDKTEKTISTAFIFHVVYPPSELKIALNSFSTVERGTKKILTGSVTSNLLIREVNVTINQVTNSGHIELDSYTVRPDKTSYSLALLNIDLGSLSGKHFTVVVDARDQSNQPIKNSFVFSIEDPPSTLKVVTKLSVSSITLGNTLKISGSVESNYIISTVTATLTGAESRSFTVDTDTKSYNLEKLNKYLDLLPRGVGYKLNISVKDKSGKTLNLPTATFNVLNPDFTIKFDANGGKNTMADQKVKDKGSTVKIKANQFEAKKVGYHFSGWNTKKNGKGTWFLDKSDAAQVYAVTRSTTVTLYAQWGANTFTIIFYPNIKKYSGTMTDQKVTYGSNDTIKAIGFTHTCYKFTGWKTENGTTYKNKAAAGKMTTDQGGKVKLYAQWKLNSHTNPTVWNCSSSGANHSGKCTKCGEAITAAHTYPKSYKYNATTHYRYCTGCGYKCFNYHGWKIGKGDASGHAVKCTTCGYKSTQGHSYVYDSSASTPRNASGHMVKCSGCGFKNSTRQSHSWVYVGTQMQCSVCKWYKGQK